jgi:hypothetical protein
MARSLSASMLADSRSARKASFSAEICVFLARSRASLTDCTAIAKAANMAQIIAQIRNPRFMF